MESPTIDKEALEVAAQYSVSHSDAVQHLSRGVGARQCRAPTGVPHANEKRYKMKGIIEMIESVGARVVYLSPYSPEFNPIEHLWWQLKAFIRKFLPKNILAVVQLLSLGVLLCSSQQLQNYFSHCCYCTS
ncbi:MAG: transposase [Nostoc sp.]|uniref:transposase n=1 Tax=Nostoc sp. TaxID=1180 RepID=UPI002FFB94D1